MYSSKLPRRFMAPNVPPTPDEMVAGELVINSVDGKLYTKTSGDNRVHVIGTPAIETVADYVTADISAFQALIPQKGVLIVGDGSTWQSLAPSSRNYEIMVTDSSIPVGIGWGTISHINPPDDGASPDKPIFTLIGAVNQTGDYLDIINSDGDVVSAISAKGHLAVGGSPSTAYLITATEHTDNAVIGGYYGDLSYTANSYNQNNSRSLFAGILTPTIGTGYTVTGTVYGINVDASRKNNDAGTLTTLTGMYLSYGNRHPSNTTSYITNNYGILLQPYNTGGNIAQQFDLYIAIPTGMANAPAGNIIDHWGIYQADLSAHNYLAGITAIGWLGDGSSTLDVHQTTFTGCSIVGASPDNTSDSCSLNLSLPKILHGISNNTIYGIQSRTVLVEPGEGTVTGLMGCQLTYGSTAQTNNTIHTLYGLKLIPEIGFLNCTNTYDIFIATAAIGNYTITNRWSVYQQDARADNFWAGTTMFGGILADLTRDPLIYAEGTEANHISTVVLIDHEHILSSTNKGRTALGANLATTLTSGMSGGVSYGINNANLTVGDGNGYLSQLVGINNTYGHNLNQDAGGAIASCYGALFAPYMANGSVTNLFDIYIANVTGSGSISNHYSIWQEDAQAINFLRGPLLSGNPDWAGGQISAQSDDASIGDAPWDIPNQYYGYRFTHRQLTTQNRNSSQAGVYIDFQEQITDGCREDGRTQGLLIDAHLSGNSITAESLTGVLVNYGPIGSGTLNTVYGLSLRPTLGACDVTTFCDLYIGNLIGSGVTTHYGISQADAGAINVFNGQIRAVGGIHITDSNDPPFTYLTINRGTSNPQLVLGRPDTSLTIMGANGQTAALTHWYDGSGVQQASIGVDGSLSFNGRLWFTSGSLTANIAYNVGSDKLLCFSAGLRGTSCGIFPTLGNTLLIGTNDTAGDANHWAGIGTYSMPQLGVRSVSGGIPTLAVQATTFQSAHLQQWQDDTGVVLSAVAADGRLLLAAPTTAPLDDSLADGQVSFYLDEAGDNLNVRVKYSNGTLKTGTIALT